MHSSSEESLSDSNHRSSSPVVLLEETGGGGEGKVVGGRGRSVGRFLSTGDESVIRNFVAEFVGQRLVPHLEAVLKNLNEWVSPSIIIYTVACITCTCTLL